jgi:uncharacterized protein involved in exopolysaccharide biosynthesis
VLGVFAVLVTPVRYTAQAYIRGEIFAAPDAVAKDDESTIARSMSLDLDRVIETQSHLMLESHRLARRVVQQLGLERLRPLENEGGLLPTGLFHSAAKTTANETDVAVTKVLSGLSVTSDPRAYLLTVRYSAEDPELAELLANAFAAELLRSANLVTLYKERALDQDKLSTQLAKFGDKHPSVAQARTRVAATDALIKQELNEGQDAVLQAAGENVTKAISSPSSRRFVIGLFLLGGLAMSVGVALWLERGRWLIMLDPSLKPSPSS